VRPLSLTHPTACPSSFVCVAVMVCTGPRRRPESSAGRSMAWFRLAGHCLFLFVCLFCLFCPGFLYSVLDLVRFLLVFPSSYSRQLSHPIHTFSAFRPLVLFFFFPSLFLRCSFSFRFLPSPATALLIYPCRTRKHINIRGSATFSASRSFVD
jgi:hypothetical protein